MWSAIFMTLFQVYEGNALLKTKDNPKHFPLFPARQDFLRVYTFLNTDSLWSLCCAKQDKFLASVTIGSLFPKPFKNISFSFGSSLEELTRAICSVSHRILRALCISVNISVFTRRASTDTSRVHVCLLYGWIMLLSVSPSFFTCSGQLLKAS